MSYVDDFGMTVSYGVGEGQELKNRTDVSTGAIHEIVTDIDYDRFGLPSANAGTAFGRGIAKIPAGSIIDDAVLYVTHAAATPATTLDVGIAKKDGTVISADGLIPDATTSTGAKYDASATLMDSSIGADDGYIVMTSAGNAAALKGLKGKLVVKFI